MRPIITRFRPIGYLATDSVQRLRIINFRHENHQQKRLCQKDELITIERAIRSRLDEIRKMEMSVIKGDFVRLGANITGFDKVVYEQNY